MPDLDALAPNYLRAQQRWPDAPTLASYYEALKTCFTTNRHGLVEYVKSFIESVCLTIMGELGQPMLSNSPNTTQLLVAALKPLGLQNKRGADKLDKVLSGFNKLANALSDMRDANGPIAHGKDGFLDVLTDDHARAFFHTGDAILGVLLNALEGKQPNLEFTREPYENFPHLNDQIDNAAKFNARIDNDGDRPMVVFSVATGLREEAIELRVEPSRLLYGIDRLAYIEVLKTTELAATDAEVGEVEEAESSDTQDAPPLFDAAAVEEPLADLVPAYEGQLESLRKGLGHLLSAEGVDPALAAEGSSQLTDSLLATLENNMGLDWRRRETLKARLKVASKRVLVNFGSDAEKANNLSERLVAWLESHAPEAGNEIPLAPDAVKRGQV